MNTLTASKIKPISHKHPSFIDEFENFFSKSESLVIASGYISADSVLHLKYYLEQRNINKCELLVGMYNFEGITQKEFDALKMFDEYLNLRGIGSVSVFTAFPYHGKLYLFGKNEINFAALLGSSNLSALEQPRRFELDVAYEKDDMVTDITELYDEFKAKATKLLNLWKPSIKETINLLGGCEGVKKVPDKEIKQTLNKVSSVKFSIPVKTEPKSNLNAFFGKGRLNKKTQVIRPRPWYEVELIVPSEITEKKGYPVKGKGKKKLITVITDDGWEFDCTVSGDYSKNFRSANDLQTLGLWIKGRLENSGALKIGEPVTPYTLKKYGRDTIDLLGTDSPDIWIMDFGVK